jgi:hypothetical protein
MKAAWPTISALPTGQNGGCGGSGTRENMFSTWTTFAIRRWDGRPPKPCGGQEPDRLMVFRPRSRWPPSIKRKGNAPVSVPADDDRTHRSRVLESRRGRARLFRWFGNHRCRSKTELARVHLYRTRSRLSSGRNCAPFGCVEATDLRIFAPPRPLLRRLRA